MTSRFQAFLAILADLQFTGENLPPPLTGLSCDVLMGGVVFFALDSVEIRPIQKGILLAIEWNAFLPYQAQPIW
jgi:hypothetical protein